MNRRVKNQTRLGICSVSPFDQSPRCPHEEILGPYLSRNFAEFLRNLSQRFSTKFRGESLRRNNSFLFFSAKKNILRKGCSAAKREKRALLFFG